ncbi:putative transcription factor & lipid binding Homobox-WOX family [Rosa chinensis]|uniref:Putative transcription factor & lipid binding Homobox-WOX family n=1 Tax=Rosa chinensis TaxID=74649 RepID=A0A2P6SMY1_ROSCH|nr:homeobox-leucine zipper protein HDG1 isoform X2 [Rosa chinensis]PRQ60048.1 putative transcription factor & lipid binding Homobox-WOX family [Rosa chinensis]
MNFGGLISNSGGVGGSRVVAEIDPHSSGGAIAQPHFIPNSMQTSSALSLSIVQKNMDGHNELDLIAESFDPGIIGRLREEEFDQSRSGSDHFDGASGDDQDPVDEDDRPRRKKKYHRHTPSQIQELESFFKECPHPDEKQRLDLSRRLGLETKQVKFWFQNRRTQMKTQLERHENIILRQENDKLRAENGVMKEAMSNPICHNCGGPAIPGQISFDEHQLRIENARLNDELSRICTLAQKFLGRPISNLAAPRSLPSSTAGLDLAMGINGMGCLNAGASNQLSMGFELGDGVGSSSPVMPLMKPVMGMPNDLQHMTDRHVYLELAGEAMDELVRMVQADTPLWMKSSDGGSETLNVELYRTFSCISTRQSGLVTDASRDSCMVIINSLALVETMMDANRWTDMFPTLVARASTIGMISSGPNGTRNGTIQMMHAELQMLSPLVPVRPLKFLRFSKQHAEGVWAVVDVSIDIQQDASSVNCRRLPSGFIVQDMPNGYSKVTWIEHLEYNESGVHQLLQPLLRSGIGFGAQRWLATLQRECESLTFLMSSTNPNEVPRGLSMNSKKSMLRLAQRMMQSFCSGVCGSSVRQWDKLCIDNVSDNVRVMVRQSLEVGEPSGFVLSAATSVWMPVSRSRLFDFLRDWQLRGQWDILVSCRPLQAMVQVDKDHGGGNSVSLFNAKGLDANNNNNMLMFQETRTDASGSIVVYAPITSTSSDIMRDVVYEGGDSTYVELLPSGFAILPCVTSDHVKGEGNGSDDGGCLLTVGFQIVCDGGQPTSKLTMHSVKTVIDLISSTIQKIKSALQINDGP